MEPPFTTRHKVPRWPFISALKPWRMSSMKPQGAQSPVDRFGTCTIPGQRGGTHLVHGLRRHIGRYRNIAPASGEGAFDPARWVDLLADLWFAVQFSPNDAGLVIAGGPPTVGTSDDVFLDTGLTPPPGLVWFGGDPAANFVIAIEADITVPTEATTWGNIKALYESSSR